MRNKYKEHQRKTQRLNGKGQRKGWYCPYDLSGKTETSLTWWCDMSFYLNGIRYSITFVHPRLKYQDTCELIVWDKLYPSYPKNEVTSKVCKYKKLGKSRKKSFLYTFEDSNKEALDTWHAILWKEEAEYLKVSDIVITPSVSVKWWDYSKNIDICIPYEVNSEEGAKFLTEMIKEHYKAGTLYQWVNGMCALEYSRNDWNREQGDK